MRLEPPASQGEDNAGDEYPIRLTGEAPPGLDPRTGFRRHTAKGEELDVVSATLTTPQAAFRPSDPDLQGYVVLDFGPFRWLEDDEEIIGHPHDPFHRVDIRAQQIHGLICFFNERADLFVDGEPQEHPVTPWS